MQQPDLSNACADVIVASFLKFGEGLIADDVDTQRWDAWRWLIQVELLAEGTQTFTSFPFFVRIEPCFLEFMVGDCSLHLRNRQKNLLLNSGQLFDRRTVAATLTFFTRWIACIDCELGRGTADALSLDRPNVAARLAFGEPVHESG